MNHTATSPYITRRQILQSWPRLAGVRSCLRSRPAAASWQPKSGDEAFLDDLEHQGCLLLGASQREDRPGTRPRAQRSWGRSRSAPHGQHRRNRFWTHALCIADKRGYLAHAQIVERVKNTLDRHLNRFPEVHGFYYHFSDIETGERVKGVELSPIDTSHLLCGVLSAPHILRRSENQVTRDADLRARRLALDAEQRKDILHGMASGRGFPRCRGEHFCELMMIYLLAIGSPTHRAPPKTGSTEPPVIQTALRSSV